MPATAPNVATLATIAGPILAALVAHRSDLPDGALLNRMTDLAIKAYNELHGHVLACLDKQSALVVNHARCGFRRCGGTSAWCADVHTSEHEQCTRAEGHDGPHGIAK